MADLASVVASNIRAERSRRRLRQADLAELLGVSQPVVANIESGQRAITVSDLPALCRALNIGLDDLLRNAERADLDALDGPE